ncbi:MAG: HRDC domain-containing protein [Marinobacter sp.]|nr:HRDC domain-containing protein [Marinobacter sp.]
MNSEQGMSSEPQWLADVASLDAWLTAGQHQPLALDTEFERVNTFFAIPGLVQLGLGEDYRLLEPSVAEASALFRSILADGSRVKLLYAMSEDLDLIRHWLGLELEGALDLQLGATLAGAGFSVGYAALVERLFGAKLDKSATRSNWLARPLTADQQRYALEDVRFLLPIYQWVTARLEERGLQTAMAEESDRYRLEQQAQNDPQNYYLKLRGAWHLAPAQQALLQKLTAWREAESRQRDKPRNWVLSDALLIAIAEQQPCTLGALSRLPEMPAPVVRRYGEWLVTQVSDAQASPLVPVAPITPPLPREEQGRFKSLKKLLSTVAEQADVPIELFAPRKRLEQMVQGWLCGDRSEPFVLEGWRGGLTAPIADEIRGILES